MAARNCPAGLPCLQGKGRGRELGLLRKTLQAKEKLASARVHRLVLGFRLPTFASLSLGLLGFWPLRIQC
jgi:hypothetical protein